MHLHLHIPFRSLTDRCGIYGFFYCLGQGKRILAHLIDLHRHSLWYMRAIPSAFLIHGLVAVLGLLCLLTVDNFTHLLHHSTLTLHMLHHLLHVRFQVGQLLGYPLLQSLVQLLLGHGYTRQISANLAPLIIVKCGLIRNQLLELC